MKLGIKNDPTKKVPEPEINLELVATQAYQGAGTVPGVTVRMVDSSGLPVYCPFLVSFKIGKGGKIVLMRSFNPNPDFVSTKDHEEKKRPQILIEDEN